MRINSAVLAALTICAGCLAQGVATLSWSAAPLWPLNGDVSRFKSDQYVFLNVAASEYVVALRSPDGAVERTLHAPIHNRVAPEVATTVSLDSDGRFHYLYTLSNRASAAMPLQRWALAVEEVGHQLTLSHPVWKGGQTDAKLPGISRDQHEVYQWVSPADGALASGQAISGFEVVSDLAPGYILGAFDGKVNTPELTPEDWASLPVPAAEQLKRALGTAWDSRTLQVIGPRFAPGAELDVVEANFLFGVRDLKRVNRITNDSIVENQLESTLSEALYHPEAPVTASGLDSLKPVAGSGEAELLTALKLTMASLRAN
jgi:hypothetical protein